MSAPNDGGPALPHPGGANDYSVQESHLGLSARDYFAGKALTGWVAMMGPSSSPKETARYCYDYADAMLAARSTGRPE